MAFAGLRYGIKEVADVKFYKIETGKEVTVDEQTGVVDAHGATLVLELDTLKVSNIEMTAEQAEARGGKGNAPLIIWDYGREITITLEDALMSLNMFNLLFGKEENDGRVVIGPNTFPGTYTVVGKTFARDTNGDDHIFTFFVPKAKIQSENTITMEAEGDPTVFNMSLRVLRSGNTMMELILNTDITDAEGAIPETEWTGAGKNYVEARLVALDGTTTVYTCEAGSDWPAAFNTVTKPDKFTAGTYYIPAQTQA